MHTYGSVYRSFLRKFKKKCNRAEFKHPEFWKIVQLEGRSLSLIHSGEAASEVSEQDSRKVSGFEAPR